MFKVQQYNRISWYIDEKNKYVLTKLHIKARKFDYLFIEVYVL